MSTSTPQAGSNSLPIQQALKQACYDFGTTEGDGLTARPRFCDMIVAEARDGNVTVDGSAEAWADYQRGVYERTKGTPEEKKVSDKELAQRAGDLKHYITLGANTNIHGPEVLENARMILGNMRADGTAKGANTWDTLLVFLRKQNASPERALDDSEIEDLFRAQAAKGTDELSRLTTVLNVLNKQLGIYEDERAVDDAEEDASDDDALPEGIAGIYTARDLVESRIADLGGTRKEQRKAERARVREQKKRAKEAAQASA